MRISGRASLALLVLAGWLLGGAPNAIAQDDQFLMPDQSAAKAKQVLEQAIEALGGAAYVNVRDVTCTGRIGTFDHSGELINFVETQDSRELPDKARIEYIGKGRNTILQYVVGIEGLEFAHGGIVIAVYNGEHGWSLDRSGVKELPFDSVSEFHEQAERSIDNILRYRIHEKDMLFRYGGSDIIDGWQADWVELVDGENRTIRIAVTTGTHLPIRKTVDIRDPKTQMKSQEVEYYSNYHPISGIQTPFQITRERSRMKVFQGFFDKCDYNTNLSDALFTKASLDQRWAQTDKKEMEKDSKDKKKDKNSSSSDE